MNRTTAPHIGTLVLVAGVNALSMNVFVPSLPSMARDLNADYAIVQFAVSLYLVATAILQLVLGPASDRYGRRPVILAAFSIFLVGTAAAIVAPTIETLLACRLLQAFSAAGIVLSRAIVRDTVAATEAASKIGYITMGMTLVPMIGPIIGGLLDEAFGWRSSFVLTFGLGLIAFIIVYLDLGETNGNRSSSLAAQIKTYPRLLGDRRFWGYTATAAFTSGTFYAFLGGAPYVASEMLKLTPSQYGFYFAIISAGYMLGNFVSGRYGARIGLHRMMQTGNIFAAAGMILAITLFTNGFYHPLSLFGPALFVGLGNGMTMPSANAGIVNVHPELAGSASGLGGALQIGGGAALAIVAGALLTPQSGPYPLLFVMLFSAIAGSLSTIYVTHAERHMAVQP